MAEVIRGHVKEMGLDIGYLVLGVGIFEHEIFSKSGSLKRRKKVGHADELCWQDIIHLKRGLLVRYKFSTCVLDCKGENDKIPHWGRMKDD